jgi:hypothetical protein
MASGGQDDGVQRAAEQIRRKLLRDEARLHAERAEAERLEATGWRPPHARRERSGSTVADAARAIEAMETEKEAMQAEARQRILKAAAGRGPMPMLDDAQAKLEAIERAARHFGMNNAADMFRHYLDRVGGTVSFKPEALRRYPVVQDAERGLQQHFMDWITEPKIENRTVSTKGGPVVQSVQSPWERIGDDLVNMKDGQTITRSSYWDRKFQYPQFQFLGEIFKDNPEPDTDLYAFAGAANLRGTGDFTFARHGDKIDFAGLVDHRFDEPYDLEKDFRWDNQVFSVPNLDGLRPLLFGASEGVALQKGNRAKPFRMVSGWQQRVTGTLRVDPSGRLTLEREPAWTDISPNEIRR